MSRVAHAFAWMRVRESDPNLGHFVLAEEMFDLVDAGTQERHILKAFLVTLLQTAPDTCAFDVDTYIINVAVGAGQTEGVLAFATTQLQHDGVVVMEEVGVPLALQREALPHDAVVAVFEQVGEGLVFREFL